MVTVTRHACSSSIMCMCIAYLSLVIEQLHLGMELTVY